MRKAIFLSLLSILFPLHENTILLQNGVHCTDVDLTKFIEFPNGQHMCLEIVFKRNDEVTCIIKLFGLNSSVSLKMTTFTTFKYRNISTEVQENCQTFLIIAGSITDVKEILQLDQNSSDHKKQFFPFSKIYFYLFDSDTTNNNSITQLTIYLFGNALFGYLFDVTNENVVIRDLLTNDVKRSISSYIPSDLFHPIVDTRLAKDNFRISVFNCKPFVFYQENASYDTIINEMDGTELRFVKEITTNWKKTFNLRDSSRTKLSPHLVSFNDLLNNTSDLAMCGCWLKAKDYQKYKLSTFYDTMCTTFMIPKPRKLNEASSIYTALSTYVWLLFLSAFLLSTISLNFISKIEKCWYRRESQYTNFSSALMETISVTLSQPVQHLSNGQVSLKIVLISWILFSMWMAICYTTIYTSRLSSPSYEKPINTVKQFLDQDMYMCVQHGAKVIIEELRISVNEDYGKLSTRLLAYGENKLTRRRLIDERKCGFFIHLPSENCVPLREENEDLLPTFRIMKDCVMTHLTGFIFQKYSPYPKLFNWHIRRYQEHGIIKKWYSNISREQPRYETLFEDHPKQNFVQQINLVNVSGAFFLLCIGLVLSAMSFFAEIIMRRFRLQCTVTN